LAASSFSDNSWIEENTRRGSLKPHTTAESFGGLVNFSVSRKDYNVRPSGRPSNSATKNVSGTFSLRNHFSSFPVFRPTSISQAPPEAPYLFRRNHFSSCRPAEPVRLEQPGKSGSARDRRTLFEGTTFPRSFRLRSVARAAPVDRLAENYCTF